MTDVLCVLLVPVSLVGLPAIAVAQDQLWSRQLGTSSTDSIEGLAEDGSGGVFLTGETWGSLGGAHAGLSDPWLARYDAAGNQLWIRQFGMGFDAFESSSVAAADGAGGVFVGGGRCNTACSSVQAWFAHYDGAGNELWSSALPAASGTDGLLAAARDGAGGVYVGGGTENALDGPNAGGFDAWYARSDGTGTPVWIRQFGGAADDSVQGAAPVPAGGVYLCGRLGDTGAASGDAWFARYDGAGDEVWLRQLSNGNANTLARSVCGDGAGGLYVCGYTDISLGGQPTIGGTDAFVARYDGAGGEAWTRILGTTSGDQAVSVAPNGSGGVFVTGTSTTNTNGSFHDDAWVVRFDAYGNESWSADLATLLDDEAGGVATDGSGGVYVGGSTLGALGGPSAGGWDAWFARHDGVGARRICAPAVANSTGAPGAIDVIGSNTVGLDDLTLIANQLPPGQLGIFLASRTPGMSTPPGSQGPLCLAGDIGRFYGGLIQGPSGSLEVDLTSIPVNPPATVMPGDTWYFQCWYRDQNPGPTSNLTDAVSVTFE